MALQRDPRHLPRKQRAIAEYIQHNPVACAGLTLGQLAELLDVNVSTVIRAAQSLGYDGYGALRRALRHRYLATLDPLGIQAANRERMHSGDLVAGQLRSDLDNLSAVVAMLPIAEIEAFARAICDARHVLIVSNGSYAAVGHVLSHLLRFMGYPVNFEARGGSYLTHWLGTLGPSDLLVGITFWRGAREVVHAVEWAHTQGIPTAAITDSESSRVAAASQRYLIIPTESTGFYQSLTASLSVAYAIVNAVWQCDPERAEHMARKSQDLYREFELQASLPGSIPRHAGLSSSGP